MNNISADKIVDLIKIEASKREKLIETDIEKVSFSYKHKNEQTVSVKYKFMQKIAKVFKILGLGFIVNFIKKKFRFRKYNDKVYLDELIKEDEDKFLENLYHNILKRDIDSDAKIFYLYKLKNNLVSKLDIIYEIANSHEAKIYNVKIIGLKKKSIFFNNIPIISYFFKNLYNIIFLSRKIFSFQTKINKIIQINYDLSCKNNILEKKIDDLINEKNNRENEFNKFYQSFETKFRGSKSEIRSRLSSYLPFVEKYKPFKNTILDLGCGRGEWLELLKDEGFSNLIGIDINNNMLDLVDKNITTFNANALEYLREQKDESVSIITGFHIIEHLPFDELLLIIKECKRILTEGGILIFETPNPKNVIVGSCDFYIDPTHINPIHPETLDFLLNYSEFTEVSTYVLNENEITNYRDINFKDINDFINIGRDLSVIGYKG